MSPESSEMMQQTPEKQNKVLGHMYVFDFDRTLVDTSRLLGIFYKAVKSMGYDPETLAETASASEGTSLNIVDELIKHIGDDETKLNSIRDEFIRLAAEERKSSYEDGGFFEPGAQELLDSIPSEQRMILTFGTSETWQEWKLAAAGLLGDQYKVLTDKVPKVAYLILHRSPEGNYQLENVNNTEDGNLCFETATIIDDKLENLVDAAKITDGTIESYLYDRSEKSSKDIIPDSIKTLRALGQIAQAA